MERKSLQNLEFDKVLGLIAGFAGSTAAKDRIHAAEPSRDQKTILDRLGELDELFLCMESGYHLAIGGIREMRDLMAILAKGEETLNGEEFLRVRANLETARQLKKSLTEAKNIPRLQESLEKIPDLSHIFQSIVQAISEQGEVRDDASPHLLGIRRDLLKSRQEIEKKLGEFLGGRNEVFQDHFFTIRNDRYVVPVKASFQSQVTGIVHDQSGSGQTVFIEPLEFLGLNNRLARLKAEDREEVKRILKSLTELLVSHLYDLESLFETLVFFDVLQAKARFARKYDGRKPEPSKRGVLTMKNARHPLIHPDCVPLDIEMNSNAACVVITGPNGGGKTVALKTIGVNALLMQTGCYVLASQSSELPIFDEILADIGESQSIEDHLSTFTSHIKRLNEILGLATSNSLVLIDEIGGGTDPVEGAALAVSVLRALVRRGILAVATSHYDALKQAAFTTPGFVNAGMEFDYQTFRPTFRFLQGIPGRSNALAISRMFGVPDEVLKEMSALLEGKGGDEGKLLEALEVERARAEAFRRSWEEKDKAISLKQADLEATMKKLETFRRTKRDEITEQYEATLKAKVKEIETLIHEVKSRMSTGSAGDGDLGQARKILSSALQGLRSLEDGPADKKDREAFSDRGAWKIGDPVIWPGIPTPGILESFDEESNRATVDFDGKSLSIALSELRKGPQVDKPRHKSVVSGSVAPTVRSELDLRGMRVEEALEQTESYLRLADVNRLGKVFLIHGKGTGALQKAIHEYLKKSPYRKKFRFGRYGEGDLGVTVVVFDPAADVDDREKPADALSSPKKRKK